jgi:hypothetical protein
VDALGFGRYGLTGGAAARRPTAGGPPPAPAPDAPRSRPPDPALAPGAVERGTSAVRPAAGATTPVASPAPPVGPPAPPVGPPAPPVGPPAPAGAVPGPPADPWPWGRASTGRGLRGVRATRATAGARGAGLDLAVGLGEGLVAARSVRDHGLAHAEVRYQRAPGGRRRALVRSITGRASPRGVVLSPAYVTADEEGNLRQEPMRADAHPTVAAEDGVRVGWADPDAR